VLKRVAELWNSSSGKDKEKFNKMHEDDVKRYQEQLEQIDKHGYFVMKDGSKSTDEANLKKQVPEGTILPKKALSAYSFFQSSQLKSIKEKEKLETFGEVQKRSGEIWNALSTQQKKPYEKLHQEDVERFTRQMKEWKDNGFFTMDDGSKSTDHKKK